MSRQFHGVRKAEAYMADIEKKSKEDGWKEGFKSSEVVPSKHGLLKLSPIY